MVYFVDSVVSAPGKVLMTGGYLILERPNAGIVLGTTARFYAIVKPLYDTVNPESWKWVRFLFADCLPVNVNFFFFTTNCQSSCLFFCHAFEMCYFFFLCCFIAIRC